ncbi:hypothetical protein ACH5AU_23885 [Streptomyces albidoflavus]
MRQYEEAEEQACLRRELAELLAEFNEPQHLSELGWDAGRHLFVGARVA